MVIFKSPFKGFKTLRKKRRIEEEVLSPKNLEITTGRQLSILSTNQINQPNVKKDWVDPMFSDLAM